MTKQLILAIGIRERRMAMENFIGQMGHFMKGYLTMIVAMALAD